MKTAIIFIEAFILPGMAFATVHFATDSGLPTTQRIGSVMAVSFMAYAISHLVERLKSENP